LRRGPFEVEQKDVEDVIQIPRGTQLDLEGLVVGVGVGAGALDLHHDDELAVLEPANRHGHPAGCEFRTPPELEGWPGRARRVYPAFPPGRQALDEEAHARFVRQLGGATEMTAVAVELDVLEDLAPPSR
jgi:hypothetical protein